jgi:DNA replication protein DnaC
VIARDGGNVLLTAKQKIFLIMAAPATTSEWVEFNVGPNTSLPEEGPADLESQERCVKLLRRSAMDSMDQLLKNAAARPTKCAIRGADGTGKSCLLLYTVQAARRNGWIVLYIPSGKFIYYR